PLGVEGGVRGKWVGSPVGIARTRSVGGGVPAGEGIASLQETVRGERRRRTSGLEAHRSAGRGIAVERHGELTEGSRDEQGPNRTLRRRLITRCCDRRLRRRGNVRIDNDCVLV